MALKAKAKEWSSRVFDQMQDSTHHVFIRSVSMQPAAASSKILAKIITITGSTQSHPAQHIFFPRALASRRLVWRALFVIFIYNHSFVLKCGHQISIDGALCLILMTTQQLRQCRTSHCGVECMGLRGRLIRNALALRMASQSKE